MSIQSPIIRGRHLGEVLRVARETATLTEDELRARANQVGGPYDPWPSQAEAAARAGMTTGRPGARWGKLERNGCSAGTASDALSGLLGGRYTAVQGEGWAAAGPDFLIRHRLGC